MTRLNLAAACAALTTLIAAPAFASEPVTAKLAAPVAQPVKFIAGGAIFNCADDSCVATAATSETFSTSSCKQVAAKVGTVVAFSSNRALDETRLQACNASAVAKSATGSQIAHQ